METERQMLTTREASSYLGFKPSYLYKMMMRREIFRPRNIALLTMDYI